MLLVQISTLLLAAISLGPSASAQSLSWGSFTKDDCSRYVLFSVEMDVPFGN